MRGSLEFGVFMSSILRFREFFCEKDGRISFGFTTRLSVGFILRLSHLEFLVYGQNVVMGKYLPVLF